MESGRRPEQNTAAESEEPRYERRRSVSGPEHQYCAPGTPKHQYTRYTNAPSTPKPGRVAVNQVHQNQYTNTSTVCQVEIAVYRASTQGIKYTKTNSPIHHNLYQYTNAPKPSYTNAPNTIQEHRISAGWSSVGDFYQGRTVFITGATGFMGKVDDSR